MALHQPDLGANLNLMQFQNREEAGRILGQRLHLYKDRADVLVLALPRGGVPVAAEVAREIHAPLDVFIVRKLGAPGHAELAMGAIARGGVRVLNEFVIRELRISPEDIENTAGREEEEIRRRELLYRGEKSFPDLVGRTIIVVDDGLATGSTMRAAIQALKPQNPAQIVVAVPVAAADACEELAQEADAVFCAATPEPFHAVGLWYVDFHQTTDEEVRMILERADAVIR